MYPPLGSEIVFRIYEPRDFEACLTIYRKNEPGRFPPEQGGKFVEYLKKEEKAFIVAEFKSRVVGYGGMNLLNSNVAALCYGIVDPEFQKQRIGTALILLRVAQLASYGDGAFFLIFAVAASMPIYRRFGFIEKSRWKTKDGNDHPIALLHVPCLALDRVKSVLKRRGLSLQGNLVVPTSRELTCEIKRGSAGSYKLRLERRIENAAEC